MATAQSGKRIPTAKAKPKTETVKEEVTELRKIETPNLPDGWAKENARILKTQFSFGKAYPAGALILVSDTPVHEYNASDKIVVLESLLVEHLDRAHVTGPIE